MVEVKHDWVEEVFREAAGALYDKLLFPRPHREAGLLPHFRVPPAPGGRRPP